jgi:hypothetical protein
MNLLRLAPVLLALVSVPLAAQAPGKTVPLRFGWQPGMRAEVEMRQVRIRETNGRRDSVRVASTYRMEVTEHPEGLAVTYADMRWTELPDVGPEMERIFQRMASTGTGGRGRTVITDGGDFVRLDGVEQVAMEMRAALAPLLAEVDSAGLSGLDETLGTMMSREALEEEAAGEWNALVGTWVQADLDVGASYSLDSSFESPLVPGLEIPMTLGFRVVDWTACNKAQAHSRHPVRCVELVMTSAPDARAVAEAVRGFMERAGVADDELEAVLGQLAVETQVTLITEPGTLRPHQMRMLEVVRAGDDEDAALRIETRTYTYRYAP